MHLIIKRSQKCFGRWQAGECMPARTETTRSGGRMMRKGSLNSCHSHVSHRFISHRSGITLVEILTAIAIAGIVALIVAGSFSSIPAREALDKETLAVASLLERARNLTIAAKNASVYGVHLESSKAVLFTGTTYSSTAATNVVEPLNHLVEISNISLAGGGSEVVFNRLTGETAHSGTITLSLVASSTQAKIITIFKTGITQTN